MELAVRAIGRRCSRAGVFGGVRLLSTSSRKDVRGLATVETSRLLAKEELDIAQLKMLDPTLRKEMDLKMLDPHSVGFIPVEDKEPAKKKLTVAQEAMMTLNESGLTRGERPTSQIFFSSVLAGTFISWGALMYVSLSGSTLAMFGAAHGVQKLTSALIFPIGLSAIVLTGTDMLTSNMMYSTLPFVSNDPRRSTESKLTNMAHLWSVSFAGNLVGCLGLAYGSSLLLESSPEAVAFATALAVKKTSAPFLATFAKAAGANWLVNLAIFQATTATTSPGKMASLWLPITTFVTLGLEHCVANMYLIPLGMMVGADVSLYDFAVVNMIPTILGNAVGASVFVSYFQWKAIMGQMTPK